MASDISVTINPSAQIGATINPSAQISATEISEAIIRILLPELQHRLL